MAATEEDTIEHDHAETVLSLYDHSGHIVQPWAEAGYDCICIDIKHDENWTEQVGEGTITYVSTDMRTYLPPLRE
jgi:2-keto-3-deoxy-L-rhamnonate aldolase RhmA